MASMRSRTQPFNPPISASSTRAQNQALPLAMLHLCLDHLHLQHGGRKEAVVDRSYHHVHPTSGGDSSRDSGDSDGDPSETPTASENPDDSTDDDGDNSDTPSHTTSQPFTQSQQSALVGTVKELLCKGKHARKSPILSSPSKEPHRGRDSSRRGSKRIGIGLPPHLLLPTVINTGSPGITHHPPQVNPLPHPPHRVQAQALTPLRWNAINTHTDVSYKLIDLTGNHHG